MCTHLVCKRGGLFAGDHGLVNQIDFVLDEHHGDVPDLSLHLHA
jgi:hypothetical protein